MKLAILGTVGVPACYGGFETLAENLVHYAEQHGSRMKALTVYCSSKTYTERRERYGNATLRYSRFDANGVQSVFYDAITALDATLRGHDRLLILGTSGAIIIPFLRLVSRVRIVVNVDGIEWRRNKWKGFARKFLKWSERLAVRYAHCVIADNQAIADHLHITYGVEAEVIAYGGDHALQAEPGPDATANLPQNYALALCRIEPENNVHMILEAFAGLDTPLVFVGNWNKSEYGRNLKARYSDCPNIIIHDPVYDVRVLRSIRDRASFYVHGHSAGGTNPSLVEMMHFGIPALVYSCSFNRHTTEGKACYFKNASELADTVRKLSAYEALQVGEDMLMTARRFYTWDRISKAYFSLLERCNPCDSVSKQGNGPTPAPFEGLPTATYYGR